MTQKQREVIVRAAATSILEVLWVASGKSLTVGTEYAAICRLPVRYWDAYAPVKPENIQTAAGPAFYTVENAKDGATSVRRYSMIKVPVMLGWFWQWKLIVPAVFPKVCWKV